jgi:hypothetical protein
MRLTMNLRTPLIIAASLVVLSGTASAQDNVVVDPALNASVATTTADPLVNDTTVQPVREEDDNDFPWGLLGLLGLAGLLGRKKKDDIHVDARNDRRNV